MRHGTLDATRLSNVAPAQRDAVASLPQFKAQAIGADRQMKSLEKSVGEWKRKCSDLQSELDGLGGDARSAAADAFR